ncbi:MAG: DUF1206 domain-containing protein [Chloroflexi bacterium]|nr:MAG: DUF1206 domain-containing protein [Chloroflexota bacterium]
MAGAASAARRARSASRRGASNSGLEFLERAGYVVRGLLYTVMGVLALGVALGVGGMATDQSGSLVVITSGPFGRMLLAGVVIGLGAYSVWGFVRAIFDPLHRGDDPPGIAERLGFAWSGIAYAAMVLLALQLLLGSSHSPSHDATQSAIASILTYPAGQWATVVVGAIAIGVGLGQFVEAYTAVFKKDLKRTEMSKAEKKTVDSLGRLGMVSRGVTFTLVGWFVVQAGLYHDPSRAHGFGGAFVFLLGQPLGRPLLAAVALGFIALGLHSFASARWERLLGSSR